MLSEARWGSGRPPVADRGVRIGRAPLHPYKHQAMSERMSESGIVPCVKDFPGRAKWPDGRMLQVCHVGERAETSDAAADAGGENPAAAALGRRTGARSAVGPRSPRRRGAPAEGGRGGGMRTDPPSGPGTKASPDGGSSSGSEAHPHPHHDVVLHSRGPVQGRLEAGDEVPHCEPEGHAWPQVGVSAGRHRGGRVGGVLHLG